jgi:two-component system, response regulator, stage 0 sporulation protein A
VNTAIVLYKEECDKMENAKKINIIIADGSKDFCYIFNDFLLNQRDIVVTGIANDGIELLKLIQEKKPDLVILDIIMPHLDGLGVLERLNTMDIFPKPHIIILSAISECGIIKRALTLGAEYFIEKPFEFNVLIKIIRQMFDDTTLQSDKLKKQLINVNY